MSTRPATWIAVDVSMSWDPRVRALGRAVGSDLPDAWVLRVMSWLKQHARDGQVADFALDIADAIRWPYDVPLDAAFRDAGLLDGAGRLAGWAALNGWLVQRAEKDRARHRKPPTPPKNVDRPGSAGRPVGRTDGRTVGRVDLPVALNGSSEEPPTEFHGASAEPHPRKRKTKDAGIASGEVNRGAMVVVPGGRVA